MTNAIPKGTCNLPVNLATEERAVWGRLAFERDQSVGSLWREGMLEWLHNHRPDLAVVVARIRARRQAVANRISLFVSGIMSRNPGRTPAFRIRP